MSSDIMNANTVLSISNLSKSYEIYSNPRDRLKQALWQGRKRFYREFWALHPISFELKKGESLGIIGRNGSGKSTLLQIIAGVLAPTTGEARIRGRVAALLELSSGFNPEFTGRENVYMQGAILEYTPDKIGEIFDDIADFADIGDFIDQPVKTYSSGMFVRLGFAVQAFIEPDILIVDEALAVGDIQFQHKCMRRIKKLLDNGTSLLFVSHGLNTVKNFCSKGIWLEKGKSQYIGDSGVAVEKYLAFMRMREADESPNEPEESPNEPEESPNEPDEGKTEPKIETPKPVPRKIQPTEALPVTAGSLNIADERMFISGYWKDVALNNIRHFAKCTDDENASAGFQAECTEIELSFLRSPESGVVSVVIDSKESLFDMHHQSRTEVFRTKIELPAERHFVTISLAPQQQGKGNKLWLLGGSVSTPPALEFRKDPDFKNLSNEVERYGSGKAGITAVELLDYYSLKPVEEAVLGQRVRLRIHAERFQEIGPRLEFSYIIRDFNRMDICGTTSTEEGIRLDPDADRFIVEFSFNINLSQGSYSILAAFVECSEDLSHRLPMDQIDIAKIFKVEFNKNRPVWYAYHEPVTVTAAALNNK